MNKKFLTYGLLSLTLALFASCNNEDDITPDTPTQGYTLTFNGGVGDDENNTSTRAGRWYDNGKRDEYGREKLMFAWQFDTTDEMVFAFMNKEGNFISPIGQDNQPDVNYYTYMRVWKSGTLSKHAGFESVDEFSMSQSEFAGYNLYAVTPIVTSENNSEVNSSLEELSATLNMPGKFTQGISGDPGLLHYYMYMHATATLNESGDAMLAFKHIPATLRFVVQNKTATDVSLSNITVTVTDVNGNAKAFAPKTATLTAAKEADTNPIMNISYSTASPTDCNESITVNISPEATVGLPRNTYKAYALVFPGVEFADDDQIIITATIDNDKHSTLAVTGEQLKNVTGSTQFLSGNLYTFNLNWNGTLSIGDLIVFGGWGTEEEEVPLN